ncbi:hypothetical protein DXT63_07545 [Thermoanaerobacteraceae bacterium SP2]|nr:hypothetical protein DXT63_07545 [Thermoanaerobacteraceae bacterium SP2]
MANYTYGNVTASNGVNLRFIKTSPNNTTLQAINANVTDTDYYGVNGGFFYNTDILSIAVVNDQPVKGNPGDYDSGWYNETYDRGTLIWDPVARVYSIVVIGSASDITVTDPDQYWAQGGISMSLQDDSNWYNQAVNVEHMPNPDGNAHRTALVYNTGLNIWYIITPTSCTAGQFRSAIKEKIGSGTLVDGIFLDGGGSSQMQCAEYSYSGDGRVVREMVRLITP